MSGDTTWSHRIKIATSVYGFAKGLVIRPKCSINKRKACRLKQIYIFPNIVNFQHINQFIKIMVKFWVIFGMEGPCDAAAGYTGSSMANLSPATWAHVSRHPTKSPKGLTSWMCTHSIKQTYLEEIQLEFSSILQSDQHITMSYESLQILYTQVF